MGNSKLLNILGGIGLTVAVALGGFGSSGCTTTRPKIPMVSLTEDSANIPMVSLTEDSANTLTYTDDNGVKQTVYDLNGLWEGTYNNYRGLDKEIVRIEQNQENFIGWKTKGNNFVGAGKKTIKGILKDDGFKKIYFLHSMQGWLQSKGKISADGNHINIKYVNFEANLNRK